MGDAETNFCSHFVLINVAHCRPVTPRSIRSPPLPMLSRIPGRGRIQLCDPGPHTFMTCP